jgi:phosphoribosyl 1,2-cyclic phosphodiesterase
VPTPGNATVRYGGNTPCVEVRCGDRLMVLDAGTGIRELGMELDREGVTGFDLLISHFHMDHLQGFPFCTPSYHESTTIDIHLARLGSGRPLSEPFDKLMEEPHFPVRFQDLGADIRFHEVNSHRMLGDVSVTSRPVNHPGGCIAYRIEYLGKTLVYLTDHEPYWSVKDEGVREFTRGADLLIREAQYTAAEYDQKRGWGHSSFDTAAADAVQAGVQRLALFHHEPDHDDRFLEGELNDLHSRYGSSGVEISLAREGQCVVLA